MLEQYVSTYPDDEKSDKFLFRLAGVYAQALDLDRAIESYESVFERTRGTGAASAPNALANAAFLRVGVGDFAGAARNYERFGTEFPNQPDTETQVFYAGEQWERVGEREAIAFYTRYLRTFRGLNPDHEMTAVYKLAVLTEKSGARAREVESLWDDVLATYQRLAPTGKVTNLGRNGAAHAAYRRLEADFLALTDVKFGSNDTKNAELLVAKLEALPAFEAKALDLLRTYGDFEYGTGSLYLIGEAYLSMADMLFNAPPPKGLDDEELILYEEIIAEKRVPLEDKGKARLLKVVERAREAKTWTRFQTKALESLSSRFPREFAPEKEEVRGKSSALTVRRAGPVALPVAPKTPAPESTGGEQ
jgi:tetratricopeptide (TPR) repeat protein